MLIPASRSAAVFGAILLLVLYACFLAYQIAQGRAGIDCGCAGPGGDIKVSGHLVLRNVFLALAALACLNTPHSIMSNVDIMSWGLIIGFTISLILLYASSEQLISNAQKLNVLKQTFQ